MRRWAWVGMCVGACKTSGAPVEPPTALRSLAEHVILAHYRTFAGETLGLADAATALCDAPDPTTLAATREAWWAARGPWKRAEVAKFGPVVELPERIGPRIDFWPVRADEVEALIAGEQPIDEAAFATMGAATRGLPVVEFLLWNGDDTLSRLASSPRRCAVLVAASTDVHRSAVELADLWAAVWVDRLAMPREQADDAYDDVQDVVNEWVNRMAFTVENIRVAKLGKPAGDTSGGGPLPDALESRASGRSLQDARDALAGVADVWTGDVDGDHEGVRDLLGRTHDDLASRADVGFADAAAELALIPETLEASIDQDMAVVAPAQDALRALQVSIQVELAQALNVTIAFNDNDGD